MNEFTKELLWTIVLGVATFLNWYSFIVGFDGSHVLVIFGIPLSLLFLHSLFNLIDSIWKEPKLAYYVDDGR